MYNSSKSKKSPVTTAINAIIESHSFDDRWNVLEFIMQHNSLSEYFKSLCKSTKNCESLR